MTTLEVLLAGLVLDKQGPGVLYIALAEHIEQKILSGTIPVDARLPSQREMARRLGLNVTTVTRAFKILHDRNLIHSRAGGGSIVLPAPQDAEPAEAYSSAPLGGELLDLTVNRPACNAFLDTLAPLLPRLPEDERFATLQDYHPPEGAYWLRLAITEWLMRTDTVQRALPEHLIVTYGAQHALACVLRTLCKPSDVVLADEITYQGVMTLCHSLNLSLRGVAADQVGMLPEELDAACRLHRPQAIILVPTLHNPTAKTLSPERRVALAEVARRHRIPIVEDDVYRSLHDGPGPSLTTLSPELNYYIGGFSKCVAPGLRIGFVLVPPGKAPKVAGSLRTNVWCVNPLSMLIATHLLESGALDDIITRQKAELSARQALVTETLAGFPISTYPSSTHAWLSLPLPWTAKSFVSAARIRGVAVLGSDLFALQPENRPEAVRLNVGAPRSRQDLARALRTLQAILHSADGHLAGRF